MKKYDWNLEKIKEAVKESVNFTEVLNKLEIPRQGNNSKTLRKILDDNNIDYSHFTGRARSYNTNYINASEYLDNSKKITSAKLKEKLLKENLIENKCAICGLTEWQNKPIVLQLHHIDGNNQNNSLPNLQLLCPNCHSQTDNYCGNANKNDKVKYCRLCGKPISPTATLCVKCSNQNRVYESKIQPLEQLVKDLKELKSYSKIGLKYGVRDNTIKKWFIKYGLPGKINDLKHYITENNL